MSCATYINKLREKKQISYAQLSVETGIAASSLNDIKNGKTTQLSKKILYKLAQYEKRAMDEILFDIYFEDFGEYLSKRSLKYICKKATEDFSFFLDYTFNIDVHYPNPFTIGQGPLKFDGRIIKKRYSDSYILVDSWDKLIKEHWASKKFTRKTPIHDAAFLNFYDNENSYFIDIISYAIIKGVFAKNNDSRISGYHILFSEYEEYEKNVVSEYLSTITGLTIKLISVPY